MKKFYKSLMSIATAGVIALAPCGSVFATSQDETVYVKLQASGEVKNIAVTEHLLNDNHSQELESASILQNIENLNGLESFTTINGKNIWKANGNDIYYRGTTDKELPLKLSVKYFLDGVEKPVDEVIGKAGKIEIHLHYENLSKQGDLYTPFVVAVSTTLDEKNVSNVNVTNGKVVSTGRKIAVSAVATPGLYESLGIDELKGSDTVTISFETSKFELGDIYSIATPKVIDSADLKKYTDLSDVYAKMDKLSSSNQKLVAGSKTLTEGLLKLQQGVNGINNKLVLPENLIDETKMAQIKAAAKTQAEQNIEAQRATLTAGMVQ
jgi:putative membrane protein